MHPTPHTAALTDDLDACRDAIRRCARRNDEAGRLALVRAWMAHEASRMGWDWRIAEGLVGYTVRQGVRAELLHVRHWDDMMHDGLAEVRHRRLGVRLAWSPWIALSLCVDATRHAGVCLSGVFPASAPGDLARQWATCLDLCVRGVDLQPRDVRGVRIMTPKRTAEADWQAARLRQYLLGEVTP